MNERAEIRALGARLKAAGMDLNDSVMVSSLLDEQSDRRALLLWMDKNPGSTPKEIIRKAKEILYSE